MSETPTPEKQHEVGTKEKLVIGVIDLQLKGFKSILQMKLKGNEELQLEQKYKEALLSLSPLINEVTNPNDKQILERIMEKMKGASNEVTLEDISEIKRILLSIDEEILKTNLSILREKLNVINDTKGELAHLWAKAKEKVPLPVTNLLEEKTKELKGKFESLKNQYLSKLKDHPILGRVAIAILPPEIQEKIELEIDKKESEPTEGGFLDKMFGAFNSMIAKGIAAVIGSGYINAKSLLPMMNMFGGKEFKELSNIAGKIGELWKSVPEELRHLNWFETGDGFLSKVGELVDGTGINTEKVKEYLISFRDSLKTKMKEFVIKKLKKNGVTEEKIDSTIDKYFKDNENELIPSAKRFASGVGQDKEEFYGLTDLFGDGFSVVKFLGYLVEEGIIDAKDIAWNYAFDGEEGFWDVGMTSMGLIKDEMMLLAGKVSLDELKEKMKGIHLGKGQKQVLEVLLYRKGGPFFWAMSHFAQAAATLATLPAHIGQDMSKIKMSSAALFGNYEKQIKHLEYFENLLGTEASLGKSAEFLKLSNEYKEFREFMEFWNWFNQNQKKLESSGKTLQEFIGADREALRMAEKYIDPVDMKKIISSSDDLIPLRGGLARKIVGIGENVANSTKELDAIIGKYSKGALSEKYILSSMANELNTTAKATSEIIKNNEFLGRFKAFFSKIESAKSLGRQVSNLDNYFIFRNVNEAQELMKEAGAIARKFPDAVKFLFQKGAIITVAGLSLTEGDTMTDKAKSLATSMLNLIPFVGGTRLFLDSGVGLVSGKDGVKFEGNMSQLTTGIVLDGLDTMFLIKAMRSEGIKGVAKFLANPFMDMGSLALGAGRTSLAVGKFGVDIIKIAKNGELTKAFELAGEGIKGAGIKMSEGMINALRGLASRPGAIAGILAVIGGGVLWAEQAGIFDSKVSKDVKEKLEKGTIDDNIAELQEAWPQIPENDKKKIIETVVRSRLMMNGIGEADIRDVVIDPQNKRISILFAKFVNLNKTEVFMDDLRLRLQKFGLTKFGGMDIEKFSGGIHQGVYKECLKDFINKTLNKDVPYSELAQDEKDNIRSLLASNYDFNETQIQEIIKA